MAIASLSNGDLLIVGESGAYLAERATAAVERARSIGVQGMKWGTGVVMVFLADDGSAPDIAWCGTADQVKGSGLGNGGEEGKEAGKNREGQHLDKERQLQWLGKLNSRAAGPQFFLYSIKGTQIIITVQKFI